MWIYKVCQGTKKRYTIVGRYANKKEAQKAKEDFCWYNKKPTFIKRISGEEEELF